jgi:hypothetical protein
MKGWWLMRKEHFNVWVASGQDPQVWWAWCPEDTWRRCSVQELPDPSVVPSGLAVKSDSVVAIRHGPFLALVLNRPDGTEIDKMPAGYVFLSGQLLHPGGVVQHANYSGRTLPAPAEFLQAITNSGIGLVQPFPGLPTRSVGSLDQLDASFRVGLEKFAAYMSGRYPPESSN